MSDYWQSDAPPSILVRATVGGLPKETTGKGAAEKTMPSEGAGGWHRAGSNREHERSARSATVPQPSPALDRGELGQSILEYALVIAVVALVVIGIIWMIGPQLAAVFSSSTKAWSSFPHRPAASPRSHCPVTYT